MDDKAYEAMNHFADLIVGLKGKGLSFDEALKLIQLSIQIAQSNQTRILEGLAKATELPERLRPPASPSE